MYIAAFIRSLGPVKFIIAVIFMLFPIVELFSGPLSVEDLVATMMLFVLLNDLYLLHWRAITLPDSGLPSFMAGKGVSAIQHLDIAQIKQVRFIGKIANHQYFFASKRGIVFNEFVRPSECMIHKGSGRDPRMSTPHVERAWRIQIIMSLVFLALLGLGQLSSQYVWIERVIFPLAILVWSTALVLDIRKKNNRWRRSFKLVYANLAVLVIIGTMLHLA